MSTNPSIRLGGERESGRWPRRRAKSRSIFVPEWKKRGIHDGIFILFTHPRSTLLLSRERALYWPVIDDRESRRRYAAATQNQTKRDQPFVQLLFYIITQPFIFLWMASRLRSINAQIRVNSSLFNAPPTDFYVHPCSTTTSTQRSLTGQPSRTKRISEKRHGTVCTIHGWGREAAGQSLVQTVTFSRNLVHAGTRRYTTLLSPWRSFGEDAGGHRVSTTQWRPARYIVVSLKWKVSSFPGFSGALRSTVTAALREEWLWGRAPALERAHVHVVHTINTIAMSGTPAAKGSHERCQKRACSWRRGHPRRRYWYPMDVCAALPSLTLVASTSPLSLPPPPLHLPLSLPLPPSLALRLSFVPRRSASSQLIVAEPAQASRRFDIETSLLGCVSHAASTRIVLLSWSPLSRSGHAATLRAKRRIIGIVHDTEWSIIRDG